MLEDKVWLGSRRMWVEIALLLLMAAGTFVALEVALSDEWPVEPDGGDDPGPVGLILGISGSLAGLVATAVLILFFEAARLALRARHRR